MCAKKIKIRQVPLFFMYFIIIIVLFYDYYGVHIPLVRKMFLFSLSTQPLTCNNKCDTYHFITPFPFWMFWLGNLFSLLLHSRWIKTEKFYSWMQHRVHIIVIIVIIKLIFFICCCCCWYCRKMCILLSGCVGINMTFSF